MQDADVETIAVYTLTFGSGDKVMLLPETSLPSILFKEVKVLQTNFHLFFIIF